MTFTVHLPSGNTADFRDTLMRADIVEARRGMKFVTAPDGSRVTDGAFLDDLNGRVIRMMLVGWSFGGPLPRDGSSEEHRQRILNNALDEADAAAMDDAVAPWVQRIMRISAPGTAFIHTASGVRVSVADEDDAAKLAATGEFTQVEGPKAGASGTGMSSSESPALPGPTTTEPGQTPPSST